MDIKEYKEERLELNNRLTAIVSQEIESFRNKTGVNLQSVNVEMLEVGCMGDISPSLRVHRVTAKFSL